MEELIEEFERGLKAHKASVTILPSRKLALTLHLPSLSSPWTARNHESCLVLIAATAACVSVARLRWDHPQGRSAHPIVGELQGGAELVHRRVQEARKAHRRRQAP